MDEATADRTGTKATADGAETVDAPRETVPLPGGQVTAPIVVDLGRRRAREIKKLKEGRGPLIAEVNDVIAEVRSALGAELDGKAIVPLVVVYKQRKRKRSGPGSNPPLP